MSEVDFAQWEEDQQVESDADFLMKRVEDYLPSNVVPEPFSALDAAVKAGNDAMWLGSIHDVTCSMQFFDNRAHSVTWFWTTRKGQHKHHTLIFCRHTGSFKPLMIGRPSSSGLLRRTGILPCNE
jgi:hypothetical protein